MEYALILAFVSIFAISVLISLGKEINRIFSTINSQLSSAGTSR